MNPLVQQFLSSIARWVLTGLGAWFVQRGILDEGQVAEMITGAVLGIVALAWSLWNKIDWSRLYFTAAAMNKGVTLDAVRASIARGVQAPAGTGSGDVPVLVDSTTGSVKPRE